ncbi:hypothetical protein JD844_023051 [Phrynosoma platyrhinos]|uniref:Uncharacterized protein n=1 Tax=Phrynosoma platyrhinos TaxID=52577 RepID=A0ABQ7SW49_PHRPL|nr:hypothetical protein JD844_023051 [Phrynosoma platyrhinos]
MDIMHSSEPTCFCYIPNGAIHLKNVWSTIQVQSHYGTFEPGIILNFFLISQVKINSTEIFEVVSVPEEHNCQRSENLFAFLKCLINNIWQPGVSNKVIMSLNQYGDKTCFRIHPLNKAPYTVSAQQNKVLYSIILLE